MLGELHILKEGFAPTGAPTSGKQVMVTYTNYVLVFVFVCVCVSATRTLRDFLKKNVKKFKDVNSYFVSV